jgi:hypothetical protein
MSTLDQAMIEALGALKDDLMSGTDPTIALKWTSDQYGFEPFVIVRRFEKAFDMTIQQMSNVKIVQHDPLAEAVFKANQYATKFGIEGPYKQCIGKEFIRNGKRAIFARYGVWPSLTKSLVYVDVCECRVYRFGGPEAARAAKVLLSKYGEVS